MSRRLVGFGALVPALLLVTACGSSVYAQGGRYPTYPGSGYPGSRSARVYQDRAFTQGYDDGYQRGLSDGRDGDRYDVRAERDYRNADRGYDRRYGSRGEWRQNYRSGFSRGYDLGYRDGSYDSRSERNRGIRRR